MLADLGGRPVLAHVIRQARDAGLDDLFVAIDDSRLAAAVAAAGGTAIEPRGEFASGTDRIAAALELLERQSGRTFDPTDIIVNIQGDEPFIEPETIRTVALGLERSDPSFQMATAATPATPEEWDDPNTVKVAIAPGGRALAFSRAPILPASPDGGSGGAAAPQMRHLGIYAYRRAFLATFVGWPPGRLERTERLEQLRALERGVGIRVLVVASASIGIDTPEDLERARARLSQGTIDPARPTASPVSERS